MTLNPRQQKQADKEKAASDAMFDRGWPEACDRCGWSQIAIHDESDLRVRSIPLYRASNYLADATHEILVPPDGKLYLCSHHYRQYEAHIAAKGYVVREWKLFNA